LIWGVIDDANQFIVVPDIGRILGQRDSICIESGILEVVWVSVILSVGLPADFERPV
jgi:hypothetical protein